MAKNIRKIALSLTFALAVGANTVAFANPAEAPASTIVSSQPQVRVNHGQVEITVPGDESRQVQIYALTGQIVKSFNAAPGVTTVDLPAGYYIVKCDRVSCRVVIK